MSTCMMLKKMSILCAGTLLIACAGVTRHPERAPQVDADAIYDGGRQHHLAGRYEDAIAAYRTVLATAPHHVRARNALAATYARKGDFAQAIPIWRALTEELATRTGPDGAYLFANLGYAYLLGGDYDKAVAALERACLLDPLDHRAWHNLGESLRHLGQADRAALMLRQAKALREHNFQSDHAAVGGTAVAAIEAAVAMPARPDSGWAATEVRTAADGTLELLRVPSQQAIAAALPPRAPEPRTPAPAQPGLVLLEIRNGNGVTGMARALSRQVKDDGLQVTRLSNAKGFNVRRTRIEHAAAFRGAAERLAERLAGNFDKVQVVQVDNCKACDMRLILGRDLGRGALTLRPAPERGETYAAAQLPPTAP
ncbi:tetratricopeptide repeat protein [Massilia niabensis]|uniref:Tetratricopeptide repeat protein n=1 Tax=Massilia niabensis TaxID=544910 RepID=A0ABW0L644_9BURK